MQSRPYNFLAISRGRRLAARDHISLKVRLNLSRRELTNQAENQSSSSTFFGKRRTVSGCFMRQFREMPYEDREGRRGWRRAVPPPAVWIYGVPLKQAAPRLLGGAPVTCGLRPYRRL